ncbi:MAG: hypothetical protein Q8R12_01750 [bacterium]|nr:hypothetical protein [bacterium]
MSWKAKAALLQKVGELALLQVDTDELWETFCLAEKNPSGELWGFREACRKLQEGEIPPEFLPDVLEALGEMQGKSEHKEVKEILGALILSLQSRS